ncbi:MAG TPA: hypothetical protein VKS21_00030, partial [Spirochaetota bacterium]|nr:hypothetical protein [Spirochaetota bacterium]
GGTFSNYPAYYDGVEHNLLTNIRSLDRPGGGSPVNIQDVVITSTGGGTRDTSPNSNAVGFRLTHNGSQLTLLMNPDPMEQNSHPNEWLEVETVDNISWHSNMQIMIQHAVDLPGNFANGHSMNADWAELLIRSTADASGFNFQKQPGGIKLAIVNRLLPITNAGINFLKLRFPDISSLTLQKITVKQNKQVKKLTPVKYKVQKWPRKGEAAWWQEKDTLKIILARQIKAAKQQQKITISCLVSTAGLTAKPEVWITAEQFDFMPAEQKGQYATCGWQKSVYKPALICSLP